MFNQLGLRDELGRHEPLVLISESQCGASSSMIAIFADLKSTFSGREGPPAPSFQQDGRPWDAKRPMGQRQNAANLLRRRASLSCWCLPWMSVVAMPFGTRHVRNATMFWLVRQQ